MSWKPKEPVNSYSHLLGALLSVVGLAALIVHSGGSIRHIVGFSIYGASLILLYSASSTYHWLSLSARGEDILRRFDHAAIFFLIAGSYTPVCLITLRGGWGWSIFGVIWGLAITGAVFRLLVKQSPRWFTVALSMGMGWLAVVAVVPLVRAVPVAGLTWLAAGGILYTIGAVIYASKRPNPCPSLVGSHEIFHMFVLAASASHFVFMARYVLPST